MVGVRGIPTSAPRAGELDWKQYRTGAEIGVGLHAVHTGQCDAGRRWGSSPSYTQETYNRQSGLEIHANF